MQIEDINATDLATLTAQGYTENDLAMLADTEVQALLIPEDQDGGDTAETVTSDTDEPALDASATTPVVEALEAPPADAPFVPTYSAEVPADAKEQIKALKDEESAAFKKLMDGEIDADAYQLVRDRTETAVDDLKTAALTASIFSQATEQSQKQAAQVEWNRATANAFAAAKVEGIDYQAKPSLLAAYNHTLKTLGADPKNENKDAAWFLTEAHRVTKEELGLAIKPAPAARRGVDPSELPPTLRSVPVAATGSVNADEFAHMRNLTGLALERAHAAMTETQRDRWMAE